MQVSPRLVWAGRPQFTPTTSNGICGFFAGARQQAWPLRMRYGSVVPTGSVTFYTYAGAGVIGTFSHHGTCALVSGNCTVRFTAADETTGNFQVIGTYHGSHAFYKGVGSAYISVTGN